MALALPGATEGERHGHRAWSVAGKTFAWQRRFSQADLERYGEVTPPSGEVLVDAWLDCAPEPEARAYAERVGLHRPPD
jgi:hypothetical protein